MATANYCVEHNSPFYRNEKTLPDGTLSVWWSHKIKETGQYHNKPKEDPGTPVTAGQVATIESKTAPQTSGRDYDAENRGKTRCQVAVAFIKRLEGSPEITEDLKDTMEKWVEWIFTGK